MKHSISNNIKIVYDKGYRVNEDGNVINPKGKILKTNINAGGYPSVGLYINKKSFLLLIHRLKAYQKFGDVMFDKGIVVRHLNDIKTDNSFDNIAIGTKQDNYNDRCKDSLYSLHTNIGLSRRKYNAEEIKSFKESGATNKEIMLKFNLPSTSTVWDILNRDKIRLRRLANTINV